MASVKRRVSELITIEIEQAKPFQLVDIDRVHPRLRGALICALSCGCRPAALRRIDDVKKCFSGFMQTHLNLRIPKDKHVGSRTVRVFCSCERQTSKSQYCPLHSCPLPKFPIETKDIKEALESSGLSKVGYTTYSARRAAACAFAALCSSEDGLNVQTVLKNDDAKARLNNNFGWVPSSEMILHYCKGAAALTGDETAFWKPLYHYVRSGFLRSEKGFDWPDVRFDRTITAHAMMPRAIKDHRGPGRPKKRKNEALSSHGSGASLPMKKRGRPLKQQPVAGANMPAVMKKRGRPRQRPLASENPNRADKREKRKKRGMLPAKKKNAKAGAP